MLTALRLAAVMFAVSIVACGNASTATKTASSVVTDANPSDVTQRDCSEAYGGDAATCVVTECPAAYSDFLGTWEGPFESFDQELGDFRPFHNRVTYDADDCLRNVANGEVFIIGRRVDTYPEFRGLKADVRLGKLITGSDAAGQPFLRTVDDDGVNAYELQLKVPAASLSIWSLSIQPEGSEPMTFTTIDGRDQTVQNAHRRNVVVTLAVGPKDAPVWEGVVVRGYHTQTK